jgi:sec-independent protein translocase protein TatC
VARLKPVGHEDRLTLVEHLDELRTRIILAIVAFAIGFGLCFWQNHEVLKLLNDPLPGDRKPLTLGVTEPFLTTLTVSAYAGLLISLPVILYQVYAFVLPAFSPSERRFALPVLIMVPLLFIAGVAFGYLLVLGPAVHFLLNFNDTQFNIQVRARDYYSFVMLTLLAMGLLFQVPLGIVAATRLGITNPRPSVDPVTLILEMIPLIVLFELSIVLASVLVRPDRRASTAPGPEHTGQVTGG